MHIDQFWQFIDTAKAKAGPDTEARVEALRSVLGDLGPADLQSFQNHYDQQIRRVLPLGSVGRGLHHQWRLFR